MLFAMLIAAVVAMASPVSQQVARQVAQTWMQAQGMKNVAALQDITAQTPFSEFYVFAAPEGGFVLVSADDCVQPILGYSVSGHFETKDMPQHVRSFLTGYEEEIRWWKNNGKRDLPLGEMPVMAAQGGNGDVQHPAVWQELLGGAVPAPPLTTAVSPLLTTTWNQSPYYNSMCPSDSRGQSVTGCVATATAQVMKYHNHPQQGYGSHTYTSTKTVEGETYTYSNLSANFGTTTYQWSSMPNELTSGSSSAQVNAVAQLMYHVGVADEMYYSPVESGAQNYYAGEIASRRASSQESLARYFKYRPDMAAVERGFYDNATFCALLRNELDQQRPILYSGSDVVGGHSFVICGYDNNGLFYVNWGWGGYQDGHYAMGSLNPGEGGTGGNATYTFNFDNVALMGIRPNTSWSTSGTTTVTASLQGVTGGSVSVYDRTSGNAGSSYSFGDTVVLRASLPEGYRFSGWSDGSTFNPREILATGGTYSFTANAVAIGGGDTVGYCTGSSIQSYSSYAGGVKLPADALDVSKQLTEVLFYAYNPGVYDITVYTGASYETVAATASLSVTNDMAGAWQSVTLPTPVATMSDIWIIISSTDSGVWPVCLTTYSGVPSSLLLYVNDVIYEYGEYWGRTAMVKGVFHGDVEVSGDTVSYCGNNAPYSSGVGTTGTGTKQWGIMFPAGSMQGNYLKSAMIYVLDGFTGAYTLNIYRGGDTVPGTLAHSQVVNFTSSGWQEAQLDAVFALNSQNLWITFSTTGMTYPMSVCDYTGSPNSDWYTLNGTAWNHIGPALNYSWAIKAVTSQTPPSSFPPPTIAINGQTRLGTGMAYTFTATATEGANVAWTLQGANPASATGATATATWSTPGYYQVIATATNSYGTGRDTLWVQVVDYTVGDTLSYIHGDMHLTNVGTGGSTAFSWGIMMPPAFIGNRTQISGIQAGLYEVGTYTLTIYQGGNDAPQTQVATYTFNTTAADTAAGSYFTYMLPTPLTISNSSNLWVVIGSTDLEYPAGAVYHIDDPNSDWTQLNGSWYHLPQLGIEGSWEIKILTGAGSTPQPTQYTITVGSNNSAWGSVTGGGTYNSGATVTLTATPASGYHFVEWQDGNTQNPRTITVTGNAAYMAIFEADAAPQDTCLITTFPWSENFDGDLGFLNCWSVYDADQNDTTWGFSYNVGYNNSIGARVIWQLNPDDHLYLPGIPVAGTYTLNWKVRVMSSYYPETYQVWAVGNGDPVMVFSETLGDTVYQDRTASFTVATGDTVRLMWRYLSQDEYALFLDNFAITQGAPQPTQYTITVASNNNAWGTVSGGGTYNSGATVTLTATANTGYHFVQWQDGNTQNPRTITVTGNAAYMAIFEADGTPQPTGDTVSYCGNSAPQEGGVGTNSTGTKQWGIMLPANMMTNNYLKSVMLYVLDGYTGAYTLNIYRGGDTVPGTLAHSQVVNFTSSGWQEAQLDAVFALNSQNLWITFSTTGMTYPMSVCDYTGSPNSDWYTLNGTAWNHIGPALNYSWAIKAVTSQTPPSSFPPPTIAINGQTRLGTGMAYTFTATATEGANVAWTLQGANPASATGATATATWSTPGYYQVIATATNSYGTGRDTLWVQVVDYTVGDTLSYIHGDMHLTNVGTGGSTAFSWGIMMPPAFIGNRTQISGIQAGLYEVGTYTLTIYQGGNDAPQTQVATYTFNTTAADTAAGSYFTYMLPTPLTISNSSNLWVVIGSTDLEYPAGAVYHIDDPNSDWTQLNGSWYHLPQLGIEGSWEIKILTGAGSTPQPTQYTITVGSNNSAWGSVTGGGTYNSGATVTLTATPASGYRFVSWNDSNTQNPRTVTVTGNATYVATFEAIPPTQYTVSLNIGWLYGYAFGYYDTNDVYVTGAGTYVEGTEVTITASWGIADYICFVSWVTDEGDTLQGETYTFTVTRDISFTALYTGCGGIEDISGSVMSLTPNPATDYAVVSDIKAGAEVSVVDINGKVCYSGIAQSDMLTLDVSKMAAGVYFVRVSDGAATAVRKLIVK